MKKYKVKSEHYSTLKTIIRIITLGVAIWALVLSYQNKQHLEWLEGVQDNVVEKLMFRD
jgi:hypothetical protein